MNTDLEFSTFQRRPAYRYIRRSDHLPTYAQLPFSPYSQIEAKVKLFNPTGGQSWFIAAYDPESRVAWGLADLGASSGIGSIWMTELVEFRGRFGLPIERDLHWKPRPMAECLKS